MFCYIENASTNPYFNLALEQVIFDRLDRRRDYCMLWQNSSAVIVGRHQNTAAEINQAVVNDCGAAVVRRLSGGGAVYHDEGNINFTFITNAGAQNAIDFTPFCRHIQKALRTFGVPAEISGRNDITIDGKKISGNAQYLKQGRVMHHGTLLYDTGMDTLDSILFANGKIQSKGIPSVRSRVTNIRPYMKIDMPADHFRAALKEELITALSMDEYTLTTEDTAAAEMLRDEVYSRWEWNYGSSPPYNARKSRRFEGCGTIEVLMEIANGGIIVNIAFFGDFFSSEDPSGLSAVLTGCHLERSELSSILQKIDISRYFHKIEAESLLSLLVN